MKHLNFMKNKILISGINGFVGFNLKNYLLKRNNYSIHPYNREDSSNQLISKDCMIHLAGKAHDLKKHRNAEEYYASNFELTKKLFDDFINSEANVFIFLSSVKAVRDSIKGKLTEETLPDPKTDYGKSKLLAEEYILSKILPKNKRVFILRSCMIHGPGNKGNLNLLFNLVSKGVPWPLGLYKNKRSFCSIDNLLFIINELLENKNIPSGLYNVADNQPLSTNDIILLINKAQNKKPIVWNISKNIIFWIAKLGDTINLPLNSEKLHKLTESYLVCNKKLLGCLGKSLPIKSKDGMMKTLKSFKFD